MVSSIVESEQALLFEQQIAYVYDQPIRDLRHRLMVVPRTTHGPQIRRDFGISVSQDDAAVRLVSDSFANCVVHIEAPTVSHRIEFSMWALLGHFRDKTMIEPRQILDSGEFLRPTRLTEPGPVLREVGLGIAGRVRDPILIAEMASSWTSWAMTYEYGITNIWTTATEALGAGRGVCQDYAHIMLAICRSAGVASRYVSGHLVGEGGSHAWVEILLPAPSGIGVIAVGFDPTHDRRVDDRYLTVAVGRDYADVSPTSGTFSGKGFGELNVQKRLRAVEATEVSSIVRSDREFTGLFDEPEEQRLIER